MIFLVLNVIDVYQLNLKLFGNLQFLVENPFFKCVFFHFLSNKCIKKNWGKNYYFKKQ
jgi:hypothetical protein